MRILLLALLLWGAVWAAPSKTFSHEFEKADIVYAIKVLAKEMGWNVYLGPGVEGEVTLEVCDALPEKALAQILEGRGLASKFVSNGSGGETLVVALRDRLAAIPDDIFLNWKPIVCFPIDPIRQEIILEPGAPRAKVMEYLTARYPTVEFTLHPTMHGFYVYGPLKDVRQLKEEMPFWDPPEPPPPPVTRRVRMHDPELVRAAIQVLHTLTPDVGCVVEDEYFLVLTASGGLDQILELLDEMDEPDWRARSWAQPPQPAGP